MSDTLLIDTLAGMTGGFASVYVGQPLDTVKVKMQLFPSMYKSMVSCLMKTARQKGLRGLYSGTLPALTSNCAENAVMFGTYGQCQKLVATLNGGANKNTADLSYLENAAAGSIASLFTSTVLCPTELVKIRMQGFDDKKKLGPSVSQVVKSIWKTDGALGLFRGLGSTMARESIGCPLFFGSYEWARELLKPEGRRKEDCGPAATMVAGAAAGVFMWMAVYPIDMIKSRVQMSNEKGGELRLIREEISGAGFRGLYSGLWPTLVKTIPVTAVLLLSVELSKPFFRKRLSDQQTSSGQPPSSPVAHDGDDHFFSFCDFVSGWTAGIVSTCVGHPMETVRVIQQVTNVSMIKATTEIYKEDKFAGYFRGMMFPILSTGVVNSVFFGVNGNVMRYIQLYRDCETQNKNIRFCCDTDNLSKYWHFDIFASGCVAGFFYTLINVPTEVLKTILQASNISTISSSDNLENKNKTEQPKVTSSMKLVSDLYKSGGIRSFYRAGTLFFLRDIPSMGVYMLAYEHSCSKLKKLMHNEQTNTSMPLYIQTISGGLAGVLSWILVLPFDVIKSKIIVDSLRPEPIYKSAWDCTKKMYKEGGVVYFYRGFWLLCIRAFPVNGVTFFVYEMLLNACTDQKPFITTTGLVREPMESRWS